MKFTENRPIARAALALIVAGTLIIGGGNALIDQKKAVQAAFSAPSESISAELKEMADNAVVMNSIVANAKGAESEKTDAVSAAIDALNRAETIPDRYDAAQALNAAVEDLYSYGSNLKLSETDAGDFRYKYKNFSSALLRISHDSYNEQAAAFNEEKRGFPAGLISALRGIGDGGLYE